MNSTLKRKVEGEGDPNKRSKLSLDAVLHRDGVVVVPLLTPDETRDLHRAMLLEMAAFPEYVSPASFVDHPPNSSSGIGNNNNTLFVDGGFGAFGNPASFHNPTTRRIRQLVHTRALELFRDLYLPIEQLVDRFSVRPVGSSTSKESWHRDQSPGSDIVLGGWVNLDLEGGTQYLSCVPGTHGSIGTRHGFRPLTPEEKTEAESNKVKVTIPPGHWVVFHQNLVHEVNPAKAKYDSMRQYVGYRIGGAGLQPLFEQFKPNKEFGTDFDLKRDVFEKQGVPPLPSGQYPPMFSLMTQSCRKPRLLQWSASTFKPACLETRFSQASQADEVCVRRFAKSLADLGLPLYPPYTAAELAMHGL